jgi:hypothetical protein
VDRSRRISHFESEQDKRVVRKRTVEKISRSVVRNVMVVDTATRILFFWNGVQ